MPVDRMQQYAVTSLDVTDVLEDAEREGLLLTPEEAESLLKEHQDALQEAGSYAQKDALFNLIRERKSQIAKASALAEYAPQMLEFMRYVVGLYPGHGPMEHANGGESACHICQGKALVKRFEGVL
jgi:hypothetical protein